MRIEPLVSVIIPCFNQGKYLSDTVQSVLDQSYSNLEVIIVNDGSTDPATLTLLDNNNWDRTSIYHIKNSGVSKARNLGISYAKGFYILPLDGDDLIAPTYLEKAVPILEADSSITVVTTEVGYFGKMSGKFELPEFSLEGLMGQNLMVVTSLFKKSDFVLTSGYNENMKVGFEDWDLWLSLLKDGGTVYRIKEVLFFYRISRRSRNSSISLESQALLRMQIYENHKDLFQRRLLNPLLTFEYLNVVNSKEYKIGRILLKPVRYILKALNL